MCMYIYMHIMYMSMSWGGDGSERHVNYIFFDLFGVDKGFNGTLTMTRAKGIT